MAVVVSQVSGKRLMKWLASSKGEKGVETAAASAGKVGSNGEEVVKQAPQRGKQTERGDEQQIQQDDEGNGEADDNGVSEQSATVHRTRRRSTRVKRL